VPRTPHAQLAKQSTSPTLLPNKRHPPWLYGHLQIEIKPEMIAHYLAEFSISYKPVKHGRPGIGASTTSRFIPLK